MQQARAALKNSGAVPDQAKGPVMDELESAAQQYEGLTSDRQWSGWSGTKSFCGMDPATRKGETIPDGLLKVGLSRRLIGRLSFVLDNGEHLKLGGLPKSASENLATASKPKRSSKQNPRCFRSSIQELQDPRRSISGQRRSGRTWSAGAFNSGSSWRGSPTNGEINLITEPELLEREVELHLRDNAPADPGGSLSPVGKLRSPARASCT